MNSKGKGKHTDTGKANAVGAIIFALGLVSTILFVGISSPTAGYLLVRSGDPVPNTPTTIFYEVTEWTADSPIGASYDQIWAEIFRPGTALLGQDINEVSILLSKVGNPQGYAKVGVFDQYGDFHYFMGAIDVTTITTTPSWYTFRNVTSWNVDQGNRIGIAYSGGSASSYIMVYSQIPGSYGDTLSHRERWNGLIWNTYATADVTMVIGYTTPSGGVPPQADTTRPQISVTRPTEGQSVSSPIVITGRVTDNVGVARVEVRTFWFDSAAQVTRYDPYQAVAGDGDPFSASLATTRATGITVRATDTSGNQNWRHVAVTLIGSPPPPTTDTQQPVVTISSPAPGAAIQSSSVGVTGTASDNVALASVSWSIDGSAYIPATLSGNSYSFTALDVQPGYHTITVRATDTSGNMRTATVAFNVASTDPIPPPPCPPGFILENSICVEDDPAAPIIDPTLGMIAGSVISIVAAVGGRRAMM